jgi:hypothetical protein
VSPSSTTDSPPPTSRRQAAVWRALVGMQLGIVLLVLVAVALILLAGIIGPGFQQRQV